MSHVLFAELDLRRRARRPAGPPRPAAPPRYGSGNPELFAVPLRAPAPVRPPKRAPYPIEGKDPLREWADAHEDIHRDILARLEGLPNDYYASCGYLRAHRPRESGPALTFWNAPLSRAHAVNALLNREHRSIVQVHKDCDLGADKLYDYAARWGMRFRRLERDPRTTVTDPSGRSSGASVVTMDRATGQGTVRVDGLSLTVAVRYDARARHCRTEQSLDFGPDKLVGYAVAARLLGLTVDTLRRVLPPDTTTDDGAGLLFPASITALLPEHAWYTTLAAATAAVNTCRCPFFDPQRAACGLDPSRRLPAHPHTCEDRPT